MKKVFCWNKIFVFKSIIFKIQNPYTLCFIILSLFSGCANIVTPSGGDKDIIPPEIVKIEPENKSVNFSAKSFSISFNEYVQLNDISTQLIVSPPFATPPEIVVKGKNVLVKFKSELLPNTTYTMNFGNAIRDINENNPLENFTYVFSTGSFLDSLSLKGTVINAQTLELEKDVLVLLYQENSDSLPFLKLPYYYTKTDASGSFILNNLKAGKFKVVALKEDNGSFIYDDFDKEWIGFSDTLIAPYYISQVKMEIKDTISVSKTDSVEQDKMVSPVGKKGIKKSDGKSISLAIFKEEKNKQFLKKAYAEHFGKLVFVFNRKPVKFEMNVLNTSFKKEWNILESSVTGDTVIAWLSDVEQDSLNLQILDNQTILDTVLLALKRRTDKIEVQSAGKKMSKQMKNFELVLESPKTNFSLNAAKDFFITFNHPVKDYIAEKMFLLEESDTLKFSISSDDAAFRKYKINYNWKEDKKYKFYILPAGVTDIFNLTSDSIILNFKTLEKTYLGNVEIALKSENSAYIFQLTDDKNNVVYEKATNGTDKFILQGLEPKSYGMRLIIDENSNGKWDTGNYLNKKQPEKIILYPQKINVRSNWDVEVEWEVK